MGGNGMMMLGLSYLIVVVAGLQGVHAVSYNLINKVPNKPGSVRFSNEIGIVYTKRQMGYSTDFIWKLFQQQNSPADRKSYTQVDLYIDSFSGVAYAVDNQLYVSVEYIDSYSGDVKKEITGVLYHEMTHVWQWDGNGQAPEAVTEGIADYVRLKAGYAPAHWVLPGEGNQWDESYDVTARFLEYCESLRTGFIAELNKMMRNSYSDSFFTQLLGMPVDQLWKDYKAAHVKPPAIIRQVSDN